MNKNISLCHKLGSRARRGILNSPPLQLLVWWGQIIITDESTRGKGSEKGKRLKLEQPINNKTKVLEKRQGAKDRSKRVGVECSFKENPRRYSKEKILESKREQSWLSWNKRKQQAKHGNMTKRIEHSHK